MHRTSALKTERNIKTKEDVDYWTLHKYWLWPTLLSNNNCFHMLLCQCRSQNWSLNWAEELTLQLQIKIFLDGFTQAWNFSVSTDLTWFISSLQHINLLKSAGLMRSRRREREVRRRLIVCYIWWSESGFMSGLWTCNIQIFLLLSSFCQETTSRRLQRGCCDYFIT